MYTDRTLSCADCGQEFTFTAGEQEFYAQRGFTEAPKRCPSCRQIRKSQRNRGGDDFSAPRSYGSSEGGYSGNGGYSSSGGYSAAGGYSSGGGGGYSSGGGGGYSDRGERRPREMFEAVCANCGRTASVPFRPSGAKPVYCSDCFEARR